MELYLAHLVTMQDGHYNLIEDGILGVENGKITYVGKRQEALHLLEHGDKIHDFRDKWITPALIDCHTHTVYAGNRSHEFEARLNGTSYAEIAAAGGGILATVRATREASFEALYQQSLPRLQALRAQGVATVEIKSGYGLDLASERKMLQVAQQLGRDLGINVQKTYLAAHAVPPEFQGRSDDYVEALCEWLKILHGEGLVDAVDGFCEHLAFSPAQMERIFTVAKALALPVKLHAEQLSNQEGAALVARFAGLSADHIEHLSTTGVEAMAQAGTVAVLLPTAFYVLRDTQVPPIDLLRQYAVPMAVSTDCNPGTSPSSSLLLAMNMACTLFRLTPEEALAGTTVHAAKALGLQEKKGQLAVGMDADLAIWNIARPADLSYLMGQNLLHALVIGG